MWNRYVKLYFQQSQGSLNQIRIKDKDYSRPNLKDYVISFFGTVLLPLPFYVLLGVLIWNEHKGIPFFIVQYTLWILYYLFVFTICFIVPDRLNRVIRDVLYIKEKVEDRPLWVDESSAFGRAQNKQAPAYLWCHRWLVINYILFFLLSCIIPSKLLYMNPYNFPLGSMSLIFVFFAHFAFLLSFSIISIYSKPKRLFSTTIKYNINRHDSLY